MVQLSSVIISEDKLEQVKAAISQLEHHDKIFDSWGFGEIFEKGTAVSLMFHGIPGTGKTLMAQAVADYLNQSLKIIGTADIETSEPGGAERAIKKLFNIANVRVAVKKGWGASKIKEAYGVDIYNDPHEVVNPMTNEKTEIPEDQWLTGKPQLLLFDECDSLLTDRNSVGVIMSAQINTLLSELERFQGVVVFTTNRLGKLDPALERRISAKIEFEFPDILQRRAIWRRMIPLKAPIADDVLFDELADFPLAGGNIKNAVLNAAREAAYQRMDRINKDCFIKAVKKEMEGLKDFLESHEDNKNNRPVRSSSEAIRESMDAVGGLKIEKYEPVMDKVESVEKIVKRGRPRKEVA